MMRLLICGICGRTHALWPEMEGRKYEWRFMCWSSTLDSPVHPSCLEHEIVQHERYYNLDLSPLKERFGLNQLEEQINEHTRKESERWERQRNKWKY